MAHELANPLRSAAKGMVSYINKDEYIENLEEALSYLTTEMRTINSRKELAERNLEMYAATLECKNEYYMLITQIEILRKDLEKFITEYGKSIDLSLTPEPRHVENEASTSGVFSRITLPDLNDGVSKSIIDSLRAIQPKKWRSRFEKLGNLSRDVEKLCAYADLINNKLKPGNLIMDSVPEVPILQHGFFNLPQFNKLYIDKIMKHLEEDSVKRIAILGPIGVGKSTVMKMLNNRLTNCSGFLSLSLHYVIWISLPAKQDDPDRVSEIIQDNILIRLKVVNTCGNTDEKKEVICRLLPRKYILLIDQVSSHIDLDNLGIHRFGKVVVASCNKRVVEQMKIDEKIEIKKLSEKEAMEFFETSCKIRDERIRKTAARISELCDGLPLVINLVASYLKDAKSEGVWNHVERILKLDHGPDLVKTLIGVGKAHEKLYEQLEGDSMKMCAIYGALFPVEKRIEMDYLIECWMAENLIDDNHIQMTGEIACKLRAARDCGEAVVEELTARYLLERCLDHRGQYLRIPFYFRKVALQQEEIRGRLKTMSLILSQFKSVRTAGIVSDFPGSRGSNDLQALFLHHNEGLSEDGVLPFKSMKKLKILDLQQSGIKSLPDSFHYLCSLVNLYLNGCSYLESLPHEIGDLKKLEILDIRRTSIRPWLPQVVGSIDSLRCLRVSFDEKKCNPDKSEKESSFEIIKKLELLEELVIETDFSECWKNIVGPMVDTIANMEHLSTLHFNFPNVDSLKKFTSMSKSWKKVRSTFKFFVGFKKNKNQDIHGTLATRQLLFPSDRESSLVTYREVQEQVRTLTLMGDGPCVKNLGEYQFKEWKEVKVCYIQESNCLESIVDGSAPCLLANLVQLHLCDLKALQWIYKGSAITDGSLSNLVILTISRCQQLKQVLNPTLSKALSRLKYLKVEDCLKMVTIVMAENPYDGQSHPEITPDMSDILQMLERIELVNLPQLQSIFDNTSMIWSSLMIVEIERCCQLRNLPFTPANTRDLKSIKCTQSWWTSVEFEGKNNFSCSTDSLVQQFHNEGETSEFPRPENHIEKINHGMGEVPEREMLTYHKCLVPSV